MPRNQGPKSRTFYISSSHSNLKSKNSFGRATNSTLFLVHHLLIIHLLIKSKLSLIPTNHLIKVNFYWSFSWAMMLLGTLIRILFSEIVGTISIFNSSAIFGYSWVTTFTHSFGDLGFGLNLVLFIALQTSFGCIIERLQLR